MNSTIYVSITGGVNTYSCCPCTEEEDRDLNCVVSSLVQLMLDPHYRSRNGFQSLVQKEWVMAGHRFLDRCNHLKKNDKEVYSEFKYAQS